MKNFSSTLDNVIKGCIFLIFFRVEDFVLGAPWKELIIAPFVKRFKAATLGKTH